MSNVQAWLRRTVVRIVMSPLVALPLLAAICTSSAAGAQLGRSDDAWVPAMKAVHEKFKGERGTYAHFGDSITVSRAFWFGLKYAPQERLAGDDQGPSAW